MLHGTSFSFDYSNYLFFQNPLCKQNEPPYPLNQSPGLKGTPFEGLRSCFS